MTQQEVEEVLRRVELDENRSVFREGYGFESERLDHVLRPYLASSHYSDYYRLRAKFYRKDIVTGKLEWGFSRWEIIEPDTTPDGVIKTAFLLLKLLLEHEVMEGFLVDGERIFNPHRTIAAHQAAERAGRGE